VRRRARGTTFLLATAVSAALLLPASAHADPVASKRAQADAVLAQIRELDASVSKAVDEYNAARIRLDEIRAKQRENIRHLKIARSSYAASQRALRARLLALYTSGNPTTLEIILGAEDLEDLLDRADAVGRVSQQDARVVDELRSFRAEVKRRKEELKEARADQETVVDELAARRREIEGQLAERRQLLSTIRSEIERIQAEERRRQERLAAQARQRLAQSPPPASSGGSSAGSGGSGGGGGASPPVGSEATVGTPPPARYGGVVGIAMRYLGIPYKWGGASPSTGFDCSGFVMFVYAQIGVSLPHNAAMQFGHGTPVSRGDLQPGDLVFFNGLGHNGIYIGGGSFIHSPHTGDVVKISSISGWYASTYVGARRL
jgi:peptidoglycan DL-endopeptidase CwlO